MKSKSRELTKSTNSAESVSSIRKSSKKTYRSENSKTRLLSQKPLLPLLLLNSLPSRKFTLSQLTWFKLLVATLQLNSPLNPPFVTLWSGSWESTVWSLQPVRSKERKTSTFSTNPTEWNLLITRRSSPSKILISTSTLNSAKKPI